MPRPIWSRLRQFSLRTLFFAISGCSVALAIWAVPFEADVKDPDEFSFCSSGMSQKEIQDYSAELDAQRETCRVYRDLHGNRIKHGVAVLYDAKGVKLRERHWSHGKLEGMETEWESNGEIRRQTRYHDGKRHGWERSSSYLLYYEDDKLIRGESDTLHGKCVEEYHADGSSTSTEWSHNAEKLSEVTCDRQFVRQGRTTTFHANGIISCEGTWRDGREYGTWNWWDDHAKLIRQIQFDKGVRLLSPEVPRRRNFVTEREYPPTFDGELCKLLCGDSYLGAHEDSVSDAFISIEEIHSNGGDRPIRIRVRSAEVQTLLDGAKVTDEAEATSLRNALQLLLAPLRLEAIVYDRVIWVVDANEAREWVEANPVSRFVSSKVGFNLDYPSGLKLGRTTLQGLIDRMKAKDIVMRLDATRVPNATALLACEIDADIPGCTVGAAIDIAMNQLGLTYYAANDEFIIVPIEAP